MSDPSGRPPLTAPPTPADTTPGGGSGSPPDRRRRPLVGLVVLVTALALFAAAFVVGRGLIADPDDAAAPASTSQPTPSTTTAPEPTPPAGSAPEFEDLKRFVEQERGLPFLEDVQIQTMPSPEFTARVRAEFDAERDALVEQGKLLRALGLLPADLDPVEAQLDLLGDGVLGFYDPSTGELVVRRDSDGPLFRSVVVHELTHALDDQHFDLDRPELDQLGDDAAWAFLALVEGNARRVENAWLAQLTSAEQQQLFADQLALAGGQLSGMLSMPMVLPQILMSPYDYGHPFVERLLVDGQERLDATFDAPPSSSEQVLDHDVFERGEGPIAVATPPAEGPVITEGVLGDLMTGFLLRAEAGLGGLFDAFGDELGGVFGSEEDILSMFEDLLGGGQGFEQMFEDLLDDMLGELEGFGEGMLGDDPLGGDLLGGSGFGLIDTPQGWGGDAYVLWDGGDGTVCVRVDWVMDTPAHLDALRSELGTWAASDPAAVVEDPTAESVRLTRCA